MGNKKGQSQVKKIPFTTLKLQVPTPGLLLLTIIFLPKNASAFPCPCFSPPMGLPRSPVYRNNLLAAPEEKEKQRLMFLIAELLLSHIEFRKAVISAQSKCAGSRRFCYLPYYRKLTLILIKALEINAT